MRAREDRSDPPAEAGEPAAGDALPLLDGPFATAILDHSAHPVFVKDREFRFVFVNQALAEMVGYPRSQILGKTDYDLFPRDEADFFRQKDTDLFTTGTIQMIEEEPITSSGGRRHVLATTKVPLRSVDGRITHLVGTIHDITRVKESEEALRQANETLEERVRTRTAELEAAQEEIVKNERLAVLGQIAGGLAHQVRNPLAAICNAAGLLSRLASVARDDQTRQLVEIVVDEAWRANRTLSAVLDMVRHPPSDRRSCELWSLVAGALAAREMPPGIRVIQNPGSVPAIEVDAEQVRQALGNLMQNAIEAMSQGGTLTLSTRVEAGYGVVTIGDTGCGIAPELAARLFQPLVSTKPYGFGLGLATAQLLVKHQHGSISFESRPGQGSVFKVHLPLAREIRDRRSCMRTQDTPQGAS